MLSINKNKVIRILDILEGTTVDGPGFRTSIYAAGCKHHCDGCHNPQSWSIKNGHLVKIEDIFTIIKNNIFANVTFTGGDPFSQFEGFAALADMIKNCTNKTIWCYTGYLYDQILKSCELSILLSKVDVLVDGRYEKVLSDTSLLFRGSKNQRLINVPISIKHKKIIEWESNII